MRAGKNALRNKLIVRVKLAQAIIIGLLIGLIYLHVSDRPFGAQIQDRSGALFFLAINMFMSSAISVLSIFSTEKLVFIREYKAGYYCLSSYFLSKTMVELPFQIMVPIIVVTITYWLIGYQNIFSKYVVMCIVAILVNLCGMSFGTLIACAFDQLPVALAVLPLVMLPLMIFSGLFVNSGSIPAYFDWIKYLSPMKYGFAALAKSEFGGLTFKDCTSSNPADCQGESALDQLSLNGGISITGNLLVLLAMYIGLLFFAYLALLRLVSSRKK